LSCSPAQLIGKPPGCFDHDIYEHPPPPRGQLPLLPCQLHNRRLHTPGSLRTDMGTPMQGAIDRGQTQARLQRNLFEGKRMFH